MLLILFLQTLWLGLPGGLSNMVPPIATRLTPRFLNIPMDFHKTFRGERIFGDNKTLRGFLIGTLFGEIFFLLQQFLFHIPFFTTISVLPYNQLPWYFGFLFGIGALGGDMIESFLKRQLGIPPGHTWFPFDQIDWIVGLLLLLILFVPIPLPVILAGLGLGLILHIGVKFVGFLLGIDKQPI